MREGTEIEKSVREEEKERRSEGAKDNNRSSTPSMYFLNRGLLGIVKCGTADIATPILTYAGCKSENLKLNLALVENYSGLFGK